MRTGFELGSGGVIFFLPPTPRDLRISLLLYYSYWTGVLLSLLACLLQSQAQLNPPTNHPIPDQTFLLYIKSLSIALLDWTGLDWSSIAQYCFSPPRSQSHAPTALLCSALLHCACLPASVKPGDYQRQTDRPKSTLSKLKRLDWTTV